MAFAGGLGVDVSLSALAANAGLADNAVLLFSESNTRFLIEVAAQSEPEFLKLVDGVPVAELGTVNSGPTVSIRGHDGAKIVDASWADLKRAWQKPLAWE
jgi:phosphoribosylformylglycinamidine synthase